MKQQLLKHRRLNRKLWCVFAAGVLPLFIFISDRGVGSNPPLVGFALCILAVASAVWALLIMFDTPKEVRCSNCRNDLLEALGEAKLAAVEKIKSCPYCGQSLQNE